MYRHPRLDLERSTVDIILFLVPGGHGEAYTNAQVGNNGNAVSTSVKIVVRLHLTREASNVAKIDPARFHPCSYPMRRLQDTPSTIRSYWRKLFMHLTTSRQPVLGSPLLDKTRHIAFTVDFMRQQPKSCWVIRAVNASGIGHVRGVA